MHRYLDLFGMPPPDLPATRDPTFVRTLVQNTITSTAALPVNLRTTRGDYVYSRLHDEETDNWYVIRSKLTLNAGGRLAGFAMVAGVSRRRY